MRKPCDVCPALADNGVARSTYDIDLLTTDARVLGRGLWTALDHEGATVDIRRGGAASGSTRGDDPRLHAVSRRGIASRLPFLDLVPTPVPGSPSRVPSLVACPRKRRAITPRFRVTFQGS